MFSLGHWNPTAWTSRLVGTQLSPPEALSHPPPPHQGHRALLDPGDVRKCCPQSGGPPTHFPPRSPSLGPQCVEAVSLRGSPRLFPPAQVVTQFSLCVRFTLFSFLPSFPESHPFEHV